MQNQYLSFQYSFRGVLVKKAFDVCALTGINGKNSFPKCALKRGAVPVRLNGAGQSINGSINTTHFLREPYFPESGEEKSF